MTATDFYLTPDSPYGSDPVVIISAKEGSSKSEFEVYMADFLFSLGTLYSLGYLDTFIKAHVRDDVFNSWDESKISDEDYEAFKRVLDVIL